eukprot:CAMPEP_0119279962 /NCGR_PEP_ID=MMETSP1329-20130426/21809_1 /TAXON_ID=114041 /ORGANISM="Genus nov. species nov., Strain RCC1024" /LENGTH=287 /DNA_ID=CAMNT_0007280529 /DNA_START=80 /DNA_END=940 /DNA_ORIENTATION=-
MLLYCALLATHAAALVAPGPHGFRSRAPALRAATIDLEALERIPTPAFGKSFGADADTATLKAQIMHFGATMDRGQGYNPTTGDQYKERMAAARSKVDALVAAGGKEVTASALEGRWELVFSSVPHGIFRSSPFFAAIYDAYENAGAPDKADLFFRLHELQTMSWGVSKIGRVSQVIDPAGGMLYSEFDTQIFSLTVIPILGWFKLLPTFGGCVVTASKYALEGKTLALEVDYTTAKPVEGLNGLGDWIWNIKVPVGAVWKLLPWNRGRAPQCNIDVVYLDDDFRVV